MEIHLAAVNLTKHMNTIRPRNPCLSPRAVIHSRVVIAALLQQQIFGGDFGSIIRIKNEEMGCVLIMECSATTIRNELFLHVAIWISKMISCKKRNRMRCVFYYHSGNLNNIQNGTICFPESIDVNKCF